MIKLAFHEWLSQNHTHLWAWFCEYAPAVNQGDYANWCAKRYNKYLED